MLLKVIDDSRWHKLSEAPAIHRCLKPSLSFENQVHFAIRCSEPGVVVNKMEIQAKTMWLTNTINSLLRWVYFLRKRIFYCCVCG